MADAAARSVYRAIWNSDYDTDLTAKGRSAAHQFAEDLAGTLTRDGLLAAPQPEIPGPERDLLYEEAKTLGLGEAYLERRGEKTRIRAARVVRAVHNHLPGRAPIGLREAKVLGEAIAVAFENHSAPECSCDATGAPEFPHRDWCELNHPHHPCDARSCRFAAPTPVVDREALLDVLTTADEDWRNQTEETDKPYLEHLADRLIAADAIADATTKPAEPLGRDTDTPTELDGAALIAAKRHRVVNVKGWTPEHDDQHVHCELLDAARCYANQGRTWFPEFTYKHGTDDDSMSDQDWPWWAGGEIEGWYPSSDPIENLVNAGQLIAAEIDRLRRAAGQP